MSDIAIHYDPAAYYVHAMSGPDVGSAATRRDELSALNAAGKMVLGIRYNPPLPRRSPVLTSRTVLST
eukprot:800024-Rhodomonas_salina.3